MRALLFLVALFGCGPKGPQGISFDLERPSLAFGEAPKALFKEPVPRVDGQQYWITVVAADSPDSAWGSYSYLAPGSKEHLLPAPPHGGSWEVRLHDLYPQNAFKVLQRAELQVQGGPAAEPEPAQEASRVEASNAPAAEPQSVTFSVAANSSSTKFGPARAETQLKLNMRKAARDGGAFYESEAAEGHKFLLVHFPETQRRKEQIMYEHEKVRLYLEGSLELKPHSVAAGGVNSEAALQRGDPPRFETEIWMTTVNEANAYPLSVAFEVPAGAGKALLKVEDRVLELNF